MNKRILIRWLLGPSLPHLIVLGLAVWGCWGAWHHFIVAADGITSTLAKVSGNNGTIAMADEDIGAMKSLIVHADLVARHEQQQLSTYDAYGAQLLADFHTLAGKSGTAIDTIAGTANAAIGTLGQATATLEEGQRTIASAQPLLAQLTANGASLQATTDTLNDTLKRKAVGEMLDNLAGVTSHGNAIAGDFQQVADKARADFLRPIPWWQQPIKKSGQLIDIGAAIARHTP
jgi:hypothetical protein